MDYKARQCSCVKVTGLSPPAFLVLWGLEGGQLCREWRMYSSVINIKAYGISMKAFLFHK